jgi:hypothetical protein
LDIAAAMFLNRRSAPCGASHNVPGTNVELQAM